MRASVELGEELFAQGRIEEARECFLSVIQVHPEDPHALNDLGVVCLQSGQTERAEEYFRLAAKARPDYADARINLAGMYVAAQDWENAAAVIEETLEILPDNIQAVNQLALAYARLGREEERKKLLSGSRSLSLMKELIDSVWMAVNYWELAEDLTLRERLEGLAGSLLGVVDGANSSGLHYQLTAEDPAAGRTVSLEWLKDYMYYRQEESPNVALKKSGRRTRVLSIDQGMDWKMFRFMLQKEMGAEGGCLGDFTQTRKVLKNNMRFDEYDVDATMKYFRENLGPCDCHVARGVET